MRRKERRQAESDPFTNLTLDDEFVRAARIRELSAEFRERIPHIGDELELRRSQRAGDLRAMRRARRRAAVGSWFRKSVAAVVALALIATAWFSWQRDRRSPVTTATTEHHDVFSSSVSLAEGIPPAPADERPERLAQPAPLPPQPGPYRFMAAQNGTADPVAYDPCQPVHVVVNLRTAPSGASRLLDESLARLAKATGLQFVIEGATDERPAGPRSPYQPERYPQRWAPVLVAWSDPAETPALDGNVAGYGGSTAVRTSNTPGALYVTGTVALDGPQVDKILDRHGGFAEARSVMLHELGHLVGLDHVDDADQVMNHVGNHDVTEYGTGDLAGLALLGRGRCFPGV